MVEHPMKKTIEDTTTNRKEEKLVNFKQNEYVYKLKELRDSKIDNLFDGPTK